MDATPGAGAANYPQLFRQMIVRSTAAALAAVDPQAAVLEDDERQRSLYALSLALDLPEAWPAAKDLTLILAPYMEMQGFGPDWITYLEQAAAQADEQQDLRPLAQLHLHVGRLYGSLDEHIVAEQHLRQGHKIAADINDEDLQARTLYRLAQTAAENGDFQRARSLVEQVLPLVAETSPMRGHCYTILGLAALRQGDNNTAIELYQLGLQLFTAAGEQRYMAQAERTLGLAYRYAKQYTTALEHFVRSRQLIAVFQDSYELAKTQMDLGVTYWYLHQHEEAILLYSECEPIFTARNSKLYLGHLYNNWGLALRDLNRFAEAQDSFFASINIFRELNLPFWMANTLESLGGLYLKMGRGEEAVAIWNQALQELNALPETPRYLHDLLMQRIREA